MPTPPSPSTSTRSGAFVRGSRTSVGGGAELRPAVASVTVGPQLPGRRRSRNPVAASGPRVEDQLDLLPANLVQTTVAVFGNLTTLDARGLIDLLAPEATAWTAPRLREVNDTTDGDYLEALVNALEKFVGTAWVQPVLTAAHGGVPDASPSGSLASYATIRLSP